jgi:hypothetical protein
MNLLSGVSLLWGGGPAIVTCLLLRDPFRWHP